MSDQTVWLVHGTTGEYSDRQEWVVEARTTEAVAQARVLRLEELARELGPKPYGSYQLSAAAIEAVRKHPEGDPQFAHDYTGTSYYVSECPLKATP